MPPRTLFHFELWPFPLQESLWLHMDLIDLFEELIELGAHNFYWVYALQLHFCQKITAVAPSSPWYFYKVRNTATKKRTLRFWKNRERKWSSILVSQHSSVWRRDFFNFLRDRPCSNGICLFSAQIPVMIGTRLQALFDTSGTPFLE